MRPVLRTRKQLDSHLLESFHILVCLQLILTYLYDLSLLRLIIGFVLQTAFLSPLIRDVVPIPRSLDRRSILMFLMGFDLLKLMAHVITDLPLPVPGSRFLHGGLTIEFVGVRPLTSKLPLVFGDIYLLILQMMAYCMVFAPSRSSPTSIPNRSVGAGSVASQLLHSHSQPPIAETSAGDPAIDGAPPISERDLILSGKMMVLEVAVFPSIVQIWKREAERRRQAIAQSQPDQPAPPSPTTTQQLERHQAALV